MRRLAVWSFYAAVLTWLAAALALNVLRFAQR